MRRILILLSGLILPSICLAQNVVAVSSDTNRAEIGDKWSNKLSGVSADYLFDGNNQHPGEVAVPVNIARDSSGLLQKRKSLLQ